MTNVASLPPSPDESARLAARNRAVVCDLAPLRVLGIGGADAEAFLQGQLSCDVKRLPPGTCGYGSFNSPKGRMLANFVLWRSTAGGGRFEMLLPEDVAEPVARRLRMYVLRSKVVLTDVSAETRRFGIGGPDATAALVAAFGGAPAAHETMPVGEATVLGLPGPRFVVLTAPGAAEAAQARFTGQAIAAPFDVWRWLTIRAGVPIVTAATQDALVAQVANWDVLGGVDFKKGCYTGQEIIARTHYLGRLKERTFLFHADVPDVAPGDRIFSAVFEAQPCGTVINAARAPGGGFDLLAVLQIGAQERGDARLGAPDGPPLVSLPLPYSLPAATAPPGRPS
jgi:folate-binding protein YgfZ